ncbi:right-handed parallel beta-helix repeat-containing protein, partial [Bartonella bovis]|uniref:right-handed parallel beta-helix repeat-containing protein n=1 Tax=Bartonella bovis TaxID=155194 RepID=UPI001304952B
TKVDISKVKVGIQVTSGNLTVNMGEIKDVQTGITMMGSGRLTVNNGAKITFEGAGHGVKVGGTAMADIMGATIKGSGKGTGVIMESSKTMTMTNGSISNVEKAVLMKEAGTLRMDNVQISDVAMGVEANLTISGESRITFTGGKGNYGVKVGKLVESATLTSVTIRGTSGQGKGVLMNGTGTLNMTGVNISRVKMGVYAMGAKAVRISGVQISDVQTGITMSGSGKLVVRDRTRIEFTSGGTRNYGIEVGNGVTANITGAEITGGGQGTGVYATGAKAVRMEEVRISNVAMGVEVKGGILAMKGGSIGFMGEYGISLNKGGGVLKDVRMIYTGTNDTADFIKVEGGTVIAKGIKIDGNGYGQGMSVTQRGHVVLIKPTYINVDKGMTISEGTVRMFGGSMEFKGDYGVYLTKSTAALIGVTIKGNRTGKTGIKLNEGRIDLYKTNIREVQEGMTITEGIVRMEGGSVEFKGDYAVYLGKGIAA